MNPRIGIFDWLKGCAILAVLADHLHIVPERYAVWSVAFFVIVTMAVVSLSPRTQGLAKLLKSAGRLLFCYWATVLLFHFVIFPLFRYDPGTSLPRMLLHPRALMGSMFLGNLWYLLLHVQILAFVYLALPHFKSEPASRMIFLAVAASQAMFFATRSWGRFYDIWMPSWGLVMAMGYYGAVPFLRLVESKTSYRPWRMAAAFVLLAVFYRQIDYSLGPFAAHNKNALFYAPFYIGVLYFLAEAYFFAREKGFLRGLTAAVSFIGRHTLTIYIAHMGFYHAAMAYSVPPAAMFVWVLSASVLWSLLLNAAYARLGALARAWAPVPGVSLAK